MKPRIFLAIASGAFALNLGCSAGVWADDYGPLAESLRACGAVAASRERLVCYDRLLERLRRGDSAAPSPAVKQEVFGLQPSGPGPVAGAGKDSNGDSDGGARDSISARVVRVRSSASRSLIIDLDNGQSWQELTAASMLLAAGDTVKISRGALGSFRLLSPDGRFGRVMRIR